jgi:hypothetical protein
MTMYIRFTRGHFDPARYDEVVATIAELSAIAGRLPCYQGNQGGYDRAGGRFIALSFWDTVEHATFPRATVADLVPRLRALGIQMDPPEIYESVERG